VLLLTSNNEVCIAVLTFVIFRIYNRSSICKFFSICRSQWIILHCAN